MRRGQHHVLFRRSKFCRRRFAFPLGGVALARAVKVAPKYAPLCALPLLFGFQQAMEGLVWIAGGGSDAAWVERFSLAYMFFSWIGWPVWVPVSIYFLEPSRGARSMSHSPWAVRCWVESNISHILRIRVG